MILARAPLRISFVGGGTDLPDFYKNHQGAVLSATIDKFVYLAVNRTPMIDEITARYSETESVPMPEALKHTRIRAALQDLGIRGNIEIGSFASLPSKTGLGSSSAFSVALMKALREFQGRKMGPGESAEAAARLEIELVGEPIGKQDQYASAFGGLNIFRFNPDGTVGVEPVLLDYRKQLELEDHLLLFFTGITRDAGSVLREQKSNTASKFDTLKEMAGSVPVFRKIFEGGEWKQAASMLHEGWLRKKSLASSVSSSSIDALYEAALASGAWGGKIAGAGGGGCLLLFVPPERRATVRETLLTKAREAGMAGAREIPIRFTHAGAEILFNADHATH